MLVERGFPLLDKSIEYKRGRSHGNYQELNEVNGLPTQDSLVHALKDQKQRQTEFKLIENRTGDAGAFAILKNFTKQL